MKIGLPELLWYGNKTLEIDLPDEWDVEIYPMRGAADSPLTLDKIEKAIREPIGSPPLREMARGKKSAVIIFDDITRPTRVYELAPVVIEELTSGGIDVDDITFVCALGNHGAHTNHEFRKKLGDEILRRFHVFNHNPYENCVYVGETSRGTKLKVNRGVMEADLKVGIGCVTAHANVGFSGGGKIILPGVSHIDSAAHYHMDVKAMAPESCGLGNFDENVMRFDIEEAARMAGLDFKVDVLVNGRGATTEVFAGDFMEVHRLAVQRAKDVYTLTKRPEKKDIIIANAFIKANEMFIAMRLGEAALGGQNGTIVVIANAPEGQIPHYFQRSFGKNHGGENYPIITIPQTYDLMVVSPMIEKTAGDWFSNPEAITWVEDWKDALAYLKGIKGLKGRFGPKAKVGVIPNATISYIEN